MILPCPACQARFMVPDARITRKGIKIRCPKCRFVFIMKAGTDKEKAARAAAEPAPQAAASGAIGSTSSGAIGSASSGAIGSTAPARKKKPVRRRAPEEGLAENISQEEIAAIDDEEIVDMDDLAQATEQSGVAVKEAPKLEHTLPQGEGGPSVILDNSLMSAAAAHTASLGADAQPAHSVSDTWMDFGPQAVHADDVVKPAAEKWPTPPPTPGDGPQVPPPAPTPFTKGVPTEQSEAITPKEGVQAAPPTPAPADDGFDVDIDVDEEPGFDVPADLDEDDDVLSGVAAEDSAPLSMPTSYMLTALAPEYEDLTEYEGLLVEEKRALRKGPAARIIALLAIVGGIALLSMLGYLLYARLNPPKAKPPAWGNLQLHNLKHDLMQAGKETSVVRVEVQVNNASKRAKYRNVHIRASILSASGTKKCGNHAPCGLTLSRKEISGVTRSSYQKVLKNKAKSTAYNVQLNPGQDERCQVVLFCGKDYDIGNDRIKVEIDKERSTRLKE